MSKMIGANPISLRDAAHRRVITRVRRASADTFTTNSATIDTQSEDHSHRAHSDLIPILISLYSAHGSEIWGWLLVLRSQCLPVDGWMGDARTIIAAKAE
jgi:hypothetical protein